MNTLKAVFTKLPKNFRQKAESFSFNSERGKNTYKLSKKIYFFPSFPVDTWISVLAILLEVFWQKSEKVCTINKNLKKYNFLQKVH